MTLSSMVWNKMGCPSHFGAAYLEDPLLLSDGENETCMQIFPANESRFEAFFNFTEAIWNDTAQVYMTGKNISCDSVAMITALGVRDPRFHTDVYRECQSDYDMDISPSDRLITCHVTCKCALVCDLFYLRIDNLSWHPMRDIHAWELCEVNVY